MADDGGQQVLSPYHAMACNPVTTVDPMGLKGLQVMSVGMQIMTAADIAYWGGGDHGVGQFTALNAEAEAMAKADAWKGLWEKAVEGYTAGNGFATPNADGSKGKAEEAVFESNTGVDYLFDGVSFAGGSEANGLNYNRIVEKTKSGKIYSSKKIGTFSLNVQEARTNKKFGEYIEFENNESLAFNIWYYIIATSGSKNEWTYTEYKINDKVYSRISTSYGMDTDRVSKFLAVRNEFMGIVPNETDILKYWIAIHNHPGEGLTGVSPTDENALQAIQDSYYKAALINAYRPEDAYKAVNYLKIHRK